MWKGFREFEFLRRLVDVRFNDALVYTLIAAIAGEGPKIDGTTAPRG